MTVLAAAAADTIVLIVITLLVVRLLRRRPAALRHAVLAAGLTAAAAAPLLEAIGPRWELPVLASADLTTSGVTLSSNAPGGAAWIESSSAAPTPAIGWIEVAAMVWGAGTIVLLSSLLIGITRVTRLTRHCRPLNSDAWRTQAAEVSRQYGLRRPIALLESHDGAMLVTSGILRPRVIVPSGAAAWPAARVHVVLAHELAHVKRGDWALQIAAEVVCAAYWFNPLVWIACRRLRDESELACDDAVLTRGVPAADYATHLLDVARQAIGTGRAWATAPAVANPSTLERRIAAMLNASHDRAPLRRGSGIFALLAMLAMAAPIAALTLTEVAQTPAIAPAAGTASAEASADQRDVTLAPAPAPAPRPVVATPPVRRAPRPAAAVAPAQQGPASLSGVLMDPSGGVLPGVEITLTHATSGIRLSAVTSGAGSFSFPDLTPGQYTLTARLPGFASVVNEFALAPGENSQRRIAMRIGGLQETITVTCPAGAAALPAGAGRILASAKRVERASLLFPLPREVAPALAADQAQPVRVGGQIRVPRQVRSVGPICPSGLMPGATGLVIILEATIGPDGLVKDIRVLRPAQPRDDIPAEFVESAREAVQQWQYTPTLLNNVAVPVIMTVTVNYTRK